MSLLVKILVAVMVVSLGIGVVAAIVVGISGGARRHSLPPPDLRKGRKPPNHPR